MPRIGCSALHGVNPNLKKTYLRPSNLVKPNSTVKTRTVYRVCNVLECFLENGKIDCKSKI